MYKYKKCIFISLSSICMTGVPSSCDVILDNEVNTRSIKKQSIKDNQIENDYWVVLANDNLHILELCDVFLDQDITTPQRNIVSDLADNHHIIKKRLKTVAETKNISIPVSILKKPYKQQGKQSLKDWANANTFHKKVTRLLNNQIAILEDIEKITTLKNSISNSQKIKSIVLKNKMALNGLLNFKNTYTNL